MSEWITKREAFFKAAIQNGLAGPEQLDTLFLLGYNVPQPRLYKWLRRLTCGPTRMLEGRQFVNRFKLGADPEFIFSMGGERVNANGLGFKQGQAFGADNNGRLTEIRPYPSRSALEVVASILSTLRWMAALKPKCTGYEWCSGAFLQDDGIGGHVHFGRKRPGREQEIYALDAIEEVLLYLGAYPLNDVLRRRRGDAHRQIYGALHDFRLQQHGYEYRTFPSWLDSPALAFMTITLSKLAVYNPALCKGIQVSGDNAVNLQKIKNLLAYYRNVDNDARLLLMLLGREFPRHIGGDFKERWGILNKPFNVTLDHKVTVIPPAIKPEESTIKELIELFSMGTPLRFPALMKPNWTPSTLPSGYQMCIDRVSTDGAKGFGELIWDLCVSNEWPILLQPGVRGDVPGSVLSIDSNITKVLPIGWNQGLKGVTTNKKQSSTITIAQIGREGVHIRPTKDTLAGGTFPIWRAKDVQPDSFRQWKQGTKEASKPGKKYAGVVLFQSVREIPGIPV